MSVLDEQRFDTGSLAWFHCRAHTVEALYELAKVMPTMRVTRCIPEPAVNGDLIHIAYGRWVGTVSTCHREGEVPKARLSLVRPGKVGSGVWARGEDWSTDTRKV